MQTLLDKRLHRLNRIRLVLLINELVLLLVGSYLPLPEGRPTTIWTLNFGLLMIVGGAYLAVSSRIDKLKFQASGHRL